MENEHRGDGCGWSLLALFPILALLAIGALNGTLPPLTGKIDPAATWPAVVLAVTEAPAPVVIYPTAQPAPVYPTAAPVVIRPAPTWPPVSEGDPAQGAGELSPLAIPAPSPAWQAVGWALAGLIGLGGSAGLGVLLYRHVTLTRATAAAIRASMPPMGSVASAPAPAGDDPGPRASGEEQPADDGRPVDVQEYLERA